MTAPEWRAPPDTMREELPGRNDQTRYPMGGGDSDWSEQDRIAAWAQAILGVRVEFASKPHTFANNSIMLCEGSEWAVRTLASVVTGFRVVRVVPLPRPTDG